MIENIKRAMTLVLAHEGGWSNHPEDRGGPTNMGVTQRVYDGYRARKGLPQQSVRGITPGEVEAIYRHQYWDICRCDDLPSGLDYAVFDYAVNSGPKRAVQDLQRCLGVTADGLMGSVTLGAIKGRDVYGLIDDICARRLAFLKSLKTWKTFGRGWERRVAEVAQAAADMAGGHEPAQPVVATPKAEAPVRTSAVQSSTVQASAVQIVSGAGAGIAAIGTLDGYVQAIALVFAGVIVLAALWILRKRLQAWADGVR